MRLQFTLANVPGFVAMQSAALPAREGFAARRHMAGLVVI